MKIENWSIVSNERNSYSAPETQTQSLHGQVFGHPRFNDGQFVITSPMVGKNNQNEVITKSGNSYKLGLIDQDYKAWFLEAKIRLLDSLTLYPTLKCTKTIDKG